MNKRIFLLTAVFLLLTKIYAQQVTTDQPSPTPASQANSLKIVFPNQPGWNVLQEGKKLEFEVKATGGTGSRFTYALTQGLVEGMTFDTLGHFSWTPNYDFVDRLIKDRTVQLLFEARNEKNERVSQVAEVKVEHVNRPPQIGELKPFYVQYNANNTYTIESSA